jgi:uncharacterized protein with von Willebrand factor type A (vWA) domain
MTEPLDDDGLDLSHLLPDTIPDWLVDMVKKSKGRNLDDWQGLGEFYKETQVVSDEKFDRMHYRQIRETARELEDVATGRWVDDPTWFELIQDVYLALYKARPETRPEKDMKPTHLLNHAAFTKANGTREWPELRTWTQLDRWAAAMATVEFAMKLGDLFDELKDLQAAKKELQDKAQEIADKLAEDQSGIEDAEKWLDEMEQAIEDYEEAGEAFGNQIDQNQNAIRLAARHGMEEALEDAEENLELLSTFGTEPGHLKRIPHEERMKLAARLRKSRKLKELAKKAGRFTRMAMGEQARKIVHGTDEVHDIELGDAIHKVLPSELMLLQQEETKLLFLKKFSEKELMQLQLRGTEKVGRGAIICMIDTSGSMNGARETWAKAIGIALLNVARKQKRAFYALLFGYKTDPLIEFQFDPKKPPKQITRLRDGSLKVREYTHEVEAVLDFAEYEYGGGTDFEVPISRAIEVLEAQYNTDGSQKGDLIMITDGECQVGSEWLERYENSKQQLAFRHYGCLIGFRSHTLEVLCDTIYDIQELARADDSREMFSYV